MAEHMGVVESLRRDPSDEAVARYRRMYLRDLQAELGADAMREIVRTVRRLREGGGR